MKTKFYRNCQSNFKKLHVCKPQKGSLLEKITVKTQKCFFKAKKKSENTC